MKREMRDSLAARLLEFRDSLLQTLYHKLLSIVSK